MLIEQGMGGDIVYISSKNSVFAGPNNIAYCATKADQAHQVRLLAAELGEHGVKVNGVNPDGVVQGSGIFAGGWGANRAAVYGVEEKDLGEFYAQRTILKREVLPEHVANAVFVLCGPDLTPHHRAARPGRRGRRGRLPAMTLDAAPVAAVDLGASSGRVMVGRVGPDDASSSRRCTGSRTGRSSAADGLHWDVPALLDAQRWPGCGAAPGRWPASASTPGPSTTACSAAASCSDLPWQLPRRPHGGGRRGGARARSARTSSTPHRAAVPAVQHDLPARGRAAAGRGRPAAAAPGPAGLLADRPGGRERTNASTTGLLDVRTGEWDPELLALVGLDARSARRRSSIPAPWSATCSTARPARRCVAVGSHDTASAVVGVPMTEPDAAYISCGTWSLVGLELDRPVLTEESRAANFTNEGGVDGRVRFLTNVMGPWLLSESLARVGRRAATTWRRCSTLAAAYDGPEVRVRRAGPAVPRRRGDMPARIADWCREHDRTGCRTAGSRWCAASSTASPRASPPPSSRRPRWPAATSPRARRRRRRPEHPALPADRRPARTAGAGRPGRGHRARQRAGAGSRARAPCRARLEDLRRARSRTHPARPVRPPAHRPHGVAR